MSATPYRGEGAAFWAVEEATDDDVDRFLASDRSRRVHVIERTLAR